MSCRPRGRTGSARRQAWPRRCAADRASKTAAREAGLTLERPDWLTAPPGRLRPEPGGGPGSHDGTRPSAMESGQSSDKIFEVGGKFALVQVLGRQVLGGRRHREGHRDRTRGDAKSEAAPRGRELERRAACSELAAGRRPHRHTWVPASGWSASRTERRTVLTHRLLARPTGPELCGIACQGRVTDPANLPPGLLQANDSLLVADQVHELGAGLGVATRTRRGCELVMAEAALTGRRRASSCTGGWPR